MEDTNVKEHDDSQALPELQSHGSTNYQVNGPLRPGPLHHSLMASLPRMSSTPTTTRNRLQQFKDGRRNMTENLLHANEGLLDLATELQQRISKLELENHYIRHGVRMQSMYDGLEPSPHPKYAVILLDADSYLFRHEFQVNGTAGGRRAADELHLQAAEYLRQELSVPPGEPIQIILKAYAYHQGLASYLERVGFIKSKHDFDLFVEAFNQRVPLFDFSNVGSGKERADNKIREWLQHYLEQPQCGHIILGCSHDRGYVTFLEKFAADERSRNKITTLDGPVSNINFGSLGFTKRIPLWTVFAQARPSDVPRSWQNRKNSPQLQGQQQGQKQGQQQQQQQQQRVPPPSQQLNSRPESPSQQRSSTKQTKSNTSQGAQEPVKQQVKQQVRNQPPQPSQPSTVKQTVPIASDAALMNKSDKDIPVRGAPSTNAEVLPKQAIWQTWLQRVTGVNHLSVQ